MNILLLNRRDISNPAGGGAELYSHEILRGLVERHGCGATVFSCSFKGAKRDETIEGVRYLRKGNELTVHFWGFLHALTQRRKYDVMIDEFNGLGFMTFMFPNSILLIHQLYREFWFRELGIAGFLPYLIEPFLIRLYRKKTTVTISESTKTDLKALGFSKVLIVTVAISCDVDLGVSKEAEPTFVFLGRMRGTKRPADAVKIFSLLKERFPSSRLWMIGRGPQEEELRSMARNIEGVHFWGWVDSAKKMELLRRAHVLIVPSVREGFGINVVEAAAAGTPSVGYNVPGLKDAILDGKTGYLAETPEDAAGKIAVLMSDPEKYAGFSENCVSYASEFHWAGRADEFWSIISGGRKD